MAVAEAAHDQLGLARLDLVVSEVALGKEHLDPARLEARLDAVRALAGPGRPWLHITSTHHRLLADVAEGYDVLVMGADKWVQVLDPAWYDSPEARDAAVARLPRVVVAPRDGTPTPTRVELLDVHPDHRPVSSTAVRAGRDEWRAR
ncbi:MAG: hypothetical protein H0U26_04100 [Acidimicrobiia bacterium]|nr:hypothetical protein [Acidimicrobiia bacterium]